MTEVYGFESAVVGCHSYMKPLLGGSRFFGRAYNLNGIKGKFSVFLHFLKLLFSFTVARFLA